MVEEDIYSIALDLDDLEGLFRLQTAEVSQLSAALAENDASDVGVPSEYDRGYHGPFGIKISSDRTKLTLSSGTIYAGRLPEGGSPYYWDHALPERVIDANDYSDGRYWVELLMPIGGAGEIFLTGSVDVQSYFDDSIDTGIYPIETIVFAGDPKVHLIKFRSFSEMPIRVMDKCGARESFGLVSVSAGKFHSPLQIRFDSFIMLPVWKCLVGYERQMFSGWQCPAPLCPQNHKHRMEVYGGLVPNYANPNGDGEITPEEHIHPYYNVDGIKGLLEPGSAHSHFIRQYSPNGVPDPHGCGYETDAVPT